jgi:putative CRISPR-associated protein (TIGR02619 family)
MTNCISENGDLLLKNLYERYRHKPASEYEINKEDITRLKKTLIQFAKANKQASAEITSLEKLSKEITDDLSIHLLSSDTINSRICAEVIKDVLDSSLDVHFTDNNIIKGLQVKNRKSFAEDGMENLFKRIEDITGGYYENTIMNITGGYKAAIPLLTIFSQINQIPSYYIFEDIDALMKIPLLPLSIDWEIFDNYADIFHEVEKSGGGVDNWNTISAKIKKEHSETINACFEIDGNVADLSTFGRLLWKKYNGGRYLFYHNEEVKKALKDDPRYNEYILNIFEDNYKNARTKNRNGHLVLGLAQEPRIFYKLSEGSFYIYKLYQRHTDEYDRFINSRPFESLNDYGPFEVQTLKR